MKSQKVITIYKMNRQLKEWIVYQDGTYVRGEKREMPMKHLREVIKEEEDMGHIVWLETEIYYCRREEYLKRITESLELQDKIEKKLAVVARYKVAKVNEEDIPCTGLCGERPEHDDNCVCWEVAMEQATDAVQALDHLSLPQLQEEGLCNEL